MRSLSKVIKSYEYDSSAVRHIAVVRDWTADSPPGAAGPGDGAEEARGLPAAQAGPQAPEAEDPGGVPEGERCGAVLQKAFRSARQIVEAAQNYRAQQVAAARREIAKEAADEKRRGYSEGYAEGLRQGKQAGFAAGTQQGLQEGRKQAAADNCRKLEELGAMIEAVEKSKTRILQKFEGDLQELAFAMARSILKKELEIDKRAMRSIIVGAMDTYRNQEWVRIYVSDNTANILLKADGGIVKALKEVSDNVKVVASKGMDDSGCIIELPDQVIDAGIDTQLNKIRDAVRSAPQPESRAGPGRPGAEKRQSAAKGVHAG